VISSRESYSEKEGKRRESEQPIAKDDSVISSDLKIPPPSLIRSISAPESPSETSDTASRTSLSRQDKAFIASSHSYSVSQAHNPRARGATHAKLGNVELTDFRDQKLQDNPPGLEEDLPQETNDSPVKNRGLSASGSQQRQERGLGGSRSFPAPAGESSSSRLSTSGRPGGVLGSSSFQVGGSVSRISVASGFSPRDIEMKEGTLIQGASMGATTTESNKDDSFLISSPSGSGFSTLPLVDTTSKDLPSDQDSPTQGEGSDPRRFSLLGTQTKSTSDPDPPGPL